MTRKLLGWAVAGTLGAGLIVWLTMMFLPTEPLMEGVEEETVGPLIELLHHPRDPAARMDAYVVFGGQTGIGVRYAEALDPAGFRARLNGEDVSGAFRPESGKAEYVNLSGALRFGENTLLFELAPRGAGGRTREYRVSVERVKELLYETPAGAGITAGGIIVGPPGGPAGESERGGPRVMPLASERLDP